MKHPITRTNNGHKVYVDLVKSEAAANISQKPHLLTLVEEALRQTNVTGEVMRIQQDMGRIIGYNYVIKTTDADPIIYARLVGDPLYTRFVKHGESRATKYLSMVLRLNEDGDYELEGTWIGRLSPPRPGGEHESAASRAYWADHAYVLEGQMIQAQTITKTCPY
jgi:hypothetical protein